MPINQKSFQVREPQRVNFDFSYDKDVESRVKTQISTKDEIGDHSIRDTDNQALDKEKAAKYTDPMERWIPTKTFHSYQKTFSLTDIKENLEKRQKIMSRLTNKVKMPYEDVSNTFGSKTLLTHADKSQADKLDILNILGQSEVPDIHLNKEKESIDKIDSDNEQNQSNLPSPSSQKGNFNMNASVNSNSPNKYTDKVRKNDSQQRKIQTETVNQQQGKRKEDMLQKTSMSAPTQNLHALHPKQRNQVLRKLNCIMPKDSRYK